MLIRLTLALLFLLAAAAHAEAKRLRFSGYDFQVKEGRGLGPGPNDWAKSQVSVDGKGRLHLKRSQVGGKWYSGEISSISRFGFGTYEMEFVGDIGGLDKDAVFGFFNYPTEDVGPDATNEIDIEFARWGDMRNKPLNYTVWPKTPGLPYAHKTFSFPRGVYKSLHRFTWSSTGVRYYSALLDDSGEVRRAFEWDYTPADPEARIGQDPMPFHINLWGRKGLKPSDRKPVEVIVNYFKFTPAE